MGTLHALESGDIDKTRRIALSRVNNFTKWLQQTPAEPFCFILGALRPRPLSRIVVELAPLPLA